MTESSLRCSRHCRISCLTAICISSQSKSECHIQQRIIHHLYCLRLGALRQESPTILYAEPGFACAIKRVCIKFYTSSALGFGMKDFDAGYRKTLDQTKFRKELEEVSKQMHSEPVRKGYWWCPNRARPSAHSL